jgi:hypothetical protein
MNEQAEVLCDLWDGEQIPTTSHSRLYHLEPIGIGSPMVESLTSYLMRLADVHSVHPRVLISQEILPLLNIPRLYRDGRPIYGQLTVLWKDSRVLNGRSSLTWRMVQALEQLTGRDDIRFLTMLTFVEVLSLKNLLRRTRSCCPSCYEEWRKAGQVIYDPLLWALDVVSICPWHCEPLRQHCPNPDCAHTLLPLTSRGQPGYCEWCEQWLGSVPQRKAERPTVPEEERAWHQWVASAVGELLAATPSFSTPPSRERFTTVIAAYTDTEAKGNISALARLLQVPRMNVWDWQQGRSVPELGTFLRIGAILGISPLCWLIGHAEEVQATQSHAPLCEPPSSEASKRRYRRMDTQKLQSALETVLQHQEDPPLSMSEVSNRLGYDSSVLLKRFPDLCRAISARYLDYQTKKGVERLQRKCDAVRHAMYSLHAQGCYPSQRQIGKLLGSRARLREPVAYNIWKETLRELGW